MSGYKPVASEPADELYPQIPASNHANMNVQSAQQQRAVYSSQQPPVYAGHSIPMAQIPVPQQQVVYAHATQPMYAQPPAPVPPVYVQQNPAPVYVQQNSASAQEPRLIESGRWSHNLCRCSQKVCCMSLCCGLCRWSRSISRAGIMSYGKALALMLIPCFIYTICNMGRMFLVYSEFEGEMDSANEEHESHHGKGHEGPHGEWEEHYESSSDSLDDGMWHESMLGMSMAMAQGLSVLFVFIMFLWGRKKLRTLYNIQGSCCVDCIYYYFCGPCAIAQEAMHVDTVTGNLV